MIDKIPINIETETDVRAHGDKKATRPKNTAGLFKAVSQCFFSGQVFKKITSEDSINGIIGQQPTLSDVL